MVLESIKDVWYETPGFLTTDADVSHSENTFPTHVHPSIDESREWPGTAFLPGTSNVTGICEIFYLFMIRERIFVQYSVFGPFCRIFGYPGTSAEYLWPNTLDI